MNRLSPFARKPSWFKVKAPTSPRFLKVKSLLDDLSVNTVCKEANCPNAGRCWHEGAAAFMILGRICTRSCAFCDVTTGRPDPVDPGEPARLAEAVVAMGLKHVVITSVDRDDLEDGGAAHFAACLEAIRKRDPAMTTEVLTPDFRGKTGAAAAVMAARPNVFNHNVETVPRLYRTIRPASLYEHSLALLKEAAELSGEVVTKSGIMLGLGEALDEVRAVLADLRGVGVSALTVGQYLRPGLKHHPVERYWEPAVFEGLAEEAREMGFTRVESHPLARSSFHAAEQFAS